MLLFCKKHMLNTQTMLCLEKEMYLHRKELIRLCSSGTKEIKEIITKDLVLQNNENNEKNNLTIEKLSALPDEVDDTTQQMPDLEAIAQAQPIYFVEQENSWLYRPVNVFFIKNPQENISMLFKDWISLNFPFLADIISQNVFQRKWSQLEEFEKDILEKIIGLTYTLNKGSFNLDEAMKNKIIPTKWDFRYFIFSLIFNQEKISCIHKVTFDNRKKDLIQKIKVNSILWAEYLPSVFGRIEENPVTAANYRMAVLDLVEEILLVVENSNHIKFNFTEIEQKGETIMRDLSTWVSQKLDKLGDLLIKKKLLNKSVYIGTPFIFPGLNLRCIPNFGDLIHINDVFFSTINNALSQKKVLAVPTKSKQIFNLPLDDYKKALYTLAKHISDGKQVEALESLMPENLCRIFKTSFIRRFIMYEYSVHLSHKDPFCKIETRNVSFFQRQKPFQKGNLSVFEKPFELTVYDLSLLFVNYPLLLLSWITKEEFLNLLFFFDSELEKLQAIFKKSGSSEDVVDFILQKVLHASAFIYFARNTGEDEGSILNVAQEFKLNAFKSANAFIFLQKNETDKNFRYFKKIFSELVIKSTLVIDGLKFQLNSSVHNVPV